LLPCCIWICVKSTCTIKKFFWNHGYWLILQSQACERLGTCPRPLSSLLGQPTGITTHKLNSGYSLYNLQTPSCCRPTKLASFRFQTTTQTGNELLFIGKLRRFNLWHAERSNIYILGAWKLELQVHPEILYRLSCSTPLKHEII
jgi:hypothetical protein